MAEHLRLANTEGATMPPPDFLMTETAREIQRSIDHIDALPGAAMTMISGAPGVGKTATLKNFIENDTDAMMITGVCGENSPKHLSAELCQRFWIDYSYMSPVARRHALISRIDGRRLFVVCDECQHYSNDAIDWLRIVSELAGFKVVLAGDESLAQRLGMVRQLKSRIHRPVIITGVSKRDVAAYANSRGLEGAHVVTALYAVALREGGMRNVVNVLRLAARFAGDGSIEIGHIMAAIREAGLAPEEER